MRPSFTARLVAVRGGGGADNYSGPISGLAKIAGQTRWDYPRRYYPGGCNSELPKTRNCLLDHKHKYKIISKIKNDRTGIVHIPPNNVAIFWSINPLASRSNVAPEAIGFLPRRHSSPRTQDSCPDVTPPFALRIPAQPSLLPSHSGFLLSRHSSLRTQDSGSAVTPPFALRIPAQPSLLPSHSGFLLSRHSSLRTHDSCPAVTPPLALLEFPSEFVLKNTRHVTRTSAR
ncbi:hypothetical protein J6590_058755 [Homalodisca vitripennis]|nr:hypothetical protein J6590_058755 [Homalodisca vitripennis]